MATQTLELALAELAAKHDLGTISVSRNDTDGGFRWGACVHWNGYSSDDISCAYAYSGNSITDALANAIESARIKRVPLIVVPALTLELAA